MGRFWDFVSAAITARPWWTLGVLFVITLLLGSGIALRAPFAGSDAFLTDSSEVAQASQDVEDLFSDNAGVARTTILFEGDVLSPAGLAQMDDVLAGVTSDPDVAAVQSLSNPAVAPSTVIKLVGRIGDLGSATPDQIESAVASIEAIPRAKRAFDRLYGVDDSGAPLGIGAVYLDSSDRERMLAAQETIETIADTTPGPLSTTTISTASLNRDFREGTSRLSAPFFGLAVILIGALIFLFLRRLSDLVVTMLGIFVSVVWIIGAEGWLGPNGLALIGGPNALTAMVPIILVSLSVDYSIQAVARYREHRIAGEPAAQAVRNGLRRVLIPLTLAALTTAISFATSVLSPVDAIGNFGVVSGLGVALSLVVMLSLGPAIKVIIDRRKEAEGTLTAPRPVSEALPGMRNAAERLGISVARNSTPYIVGVVAVSIGFAFAATGLTSEFSPRDVLPGGSQTAQALESVEAAVGEASEHVNVVVKAEITDTRTFLNVFEITEIFDDPEARPPGAASPMEASLGLLVRETITPGSDGYDAEVAAAFDEATAGLILDPAKIQSFLDLLAAKNPDGLRQVFVNDPAGADTMLLRFSAATTNNVETQALLDDLDDLWFGAEEEVQVTSTRIRSLEILESVADLQTAAILTTVAAALIVLAAFFWATDREPVLAVIAVVPVVVVLVWVLGTMALLRIPFSPVTSLITALCIGIGVDYTIHVIHRYREQFTANRDPENAAAQTLATTGAALVGSAVTTAVGFGVMALSPAATIAQFGIVAAITIAYSLIVSVLLVPPAMAVWGAFRNMRLQSMVERMWSDLDVAIDASMEESQGA